MNYAINRAKKKKYSKNGVLKFVEKNNKLYLIDGYHRLSEHFLFDVPLDIFETEIVRIKTKIYEENFIKFNEFKPS
jgi:hypothetical protein